MTHSFVHADRPVGTETTDAKREAAPARARTSDTVVVGAADDRAEVEADQVAAAVLAALPAPGQIRPESSASSAGGRIRRAPRGDAPTGPASGPRIRRAVGPDVVRRVILDPAYEEDVFDAAEGKRHAEVQNLRITAPTVGPGRPGRDVIEQHFAGKGTKSYPAPLTGRPAAAAVPAGNVNQAALPAVLVMGPDASTGAKLPEQADAEHAIRAIADAALAQYPAVDIARAQLAASRSIRHRARGTVEDITGGGAQASDAAYYASVVARFQSKVDAALEAAFVASQPNAAMAQQALDRAKLDPTVPALTGARAIYDGLYTALAFDAAAIGHITTASAERPLLALRASLAAADRAPFLTAATASAARLAFALAHQADFTGLANAGPILRCWQKAPAVLTSVADCQTLLGLAVINNDATAAVVAASLLGTTPVPTLADLSTIIASGLFATVAEIKASVALGGDAVVNKRLLALPGGTMLKDSEVLAFNAKAGTTLADAQQCWTLLTANVANNDKKIQLVRSLALAPNATRAHFVTFCQQFNALMDRTTVSADTVVLLLNAGLLTVTGKTYNSPVQGLGATYVFNLRGQGRLEPEWHIHFQAAGGRQAARAVGSGWKNAAEKYDAGVKTFSPGTEKLKTCLTDLGEWRTVVI